MTLVILVVLAAGSFILIDFATAKDAPRHVSQGFNDSKPRTWSRRVRNHAARRLLEVNGAR
jgi:hypothetical protein